MKEEEIEKGDCGPPTRKVFFFFFFFFFFLSDLNQAVPNHLADAIRRMVRWCIRLTRLTLVCEVIRYRLVQVRQNQKKKKKNTVKLWQGVLHLPHLLVVFFNRRISRMKFGHLAALPRPFRGPPAALSRPSRGPLAALSRPSRGPLAALSRPSRGLAIALSKVRCKLL